MLKSATRKFLIIFMLILLTFSLCACGKINATKISNEDGSIDERISIELNMETILNELEPNEFEELKIDIYKQTKKEINYIKNKFDLKIIADLAIAIKDGNKEKIEYLNNLKNGIEEIEPIWQNNKLTAGVKYKNDTIYKYYYNISDENKNEPEIEEHFLYNKVIYKGYSIYVKYFDLYERMNNYYTEKYPEFIDKNKIELNYTYSTDLRREHSNADDINYIDGKYYHTWKIDENNLQKLKTGEMDPEIVIYYNIANSANCIILCLGITFILCAILLIVGIFIVRKNKKKIKK